MLIWEFRFALPRVWSTKKAKGNTNSRRDLFSLTCLDLVERSPMYDFIDSCLRNKNDMVIYEAAATIVSLKCITSQELRSAINILQTFLSSPKSVSRYAAVWTLNKVSIDYPVEVATCNTDSNRSIATLEITTLLKVSGNPFSIISRLSFVRSFVRPATKRVSIDWWNRSLRFSRKSPINSKQSLSMPFGKKSPFERSLCILSLQIVVSEVPAETRRVDDVLVEHVTRRRWFRIQTSNCEHDHFDRRRKPRSERSGSVWRIIIVLQSSLSSNKVSSSLVSDHVELFVVFPGIIREWKDNRADMTENKMSIAYSSR